MNTKQSTQPYERCRQCLGRGYLVDTMERPDGSTYKAHTTCDLCLGTGNELAGVNQQKKESKND